MRAKRLITAVLMVLLLGASTALMAAVITENDSTQPRGAPPGTNTQGQILDPVNQGFMSPAFRAQFDLGIHHDWAGMLMGNAIRDPGAFSTFSVANQDFINYTSSIPGSPTDPASPVYQFLQQLKLEKDITHRDSTGVLQPSKKLPVTADLCLRCHAPVGWMEARSEPPTFYFPFLKGQFWGARFKEYPGAPGTPRKVRLGKESEAEMDGVQCDFCHRSYDNFKRSSLLDGSTIPNGNGGFFVDLNNIFGQGAAQPAFSFQGTGEFCGTCHDVTNPLFKTKTPVSGAVPDMLHPIERTATEWYWSGLRTAGITCQDCHAPMKFLGAQTWNLLGMNDLWGPVDAKWLNPPFNYNWITQRRGVAFRDAAQRNNAFMQTAATVTIEGLPPNAAAGDTVTATIKVVNNCGHKLPTGYGEGRQMWIHIQAADANGQVFFEDGILDGKGKLVRTPETKVYEIIALAEGYDTNVLNGFNILDANKDGVVTHEEKEFHFILMNFIEKDNRIPPAGFNKAGFTADGAFIVPRDPKDIDYPDGQNWDNTPYNITIPAGVTGPVTITTTLRYQTFNKEYVDFLNKEDKEPTVENGGRARNIPPGPYHTSTTWGHVNKRIWSQQNKGQPVDMATVQASIAVP